MNDHPFSAAARISIRLEFAGETVLTLLLARSGALNRMGDGSGEPDTLLPAMGHVDPSWFEEALGLFPPELAELAGRYEFSDREGEDCLLTIAFEGEGFDTGYEFLYGSESAGPPEEIADWVDEILDLTDDWYAEQLEKRAGNQKKS
jgi:hypothetical protein